MKITLNKDVIRDVLQKNCEIVGSKSANATAPLQQSYASVLLDVSKDGLTLVTTDGDLLMEGRIAASDIQVDQEGSTCVRASDLNSIIREMAADEVFTMELVATGDANQGSHVLITAKGSDYKLAAFNTKDFPTFTKADAPLLELSSQDLAIMLDRVAYAIAEKDVRHYLMGMLVELGADGKIRCVATDGHRLALAEGEMGQKLDKDLQILMPRKAAQVLKGIIGPGAKDQKVTISSENKDVQEVTHVSLNYGAFCLSTRLIEATYPNYREVLPEDGAAVNGGFTAPWQSMRQAIDRTSVLQEDGRNIPSLRMALDDKGGLQLRSGTDAQYARTDVQVKDANGSFDARFSARYMREAINAMNEDGEVSFSFFSVDKGSKLEPGKPDKGANGDIISFSIMMPLRH